jgi:CRISP-associated protein Cas1
MTLLLNTLYLTLPESSLHKEGETVVVKVEREKRLQVPLHHLAAIVIMAEAWMSPDLMRTCLERDICVTFMNERGRFLGRVEGTAAPGAWLRKNQMETHLDSAKTLTLAKTLVQGKLANQRYVLQRASREREGDAQQCMNGVIERLQGIQRQVDRMETLDQVRGCEGEGAACYFEVFGTLIRQQNDAFLWNGRNRRPPKDPLNALLSFAYALLMSDCLSACQSVGLDPAFGFLHAFRPGRPSLALDLMEAFRPVLADRLVLTLVNNQQVRVSDFTRTESGAVILSDEARKLMITSHQQRKAQTLRHPFLGQEIPWGLVPVLEARLLARHLRGDLETFPPFHPKG